MNAPDDNPKPTLVEDELDRDEEPETDWFATAQQLCHEPFERLTDGR